MKTTVNVVCAAVFGYCVWRLITPDEHMRMVRMKMAKNVESYAMQKATAWAQVADAAQQQYDAQRLTIL